MDSMTKENEALLKEIIYEKSCECPLCKSEIKRKNVKGSKLRLISTDIDLNAHYDKINPLFYEVTVCTCCGFAQLNKREEMPTLAESDLILKSISMKFTGRHYNEFYTAEDAIDRYKMALFNAIVRNATEGEKAYIALKIAWVYRELEDKEQERRFLEEARRGFLYAYQKEDFPIFELQEITVCYLIAALCYECDDTKEAFKWLQEALRSKESSPKLKDRCFVLKQMIKDKEKEQMEKMGQVKE